VFYRLTTGQLPFKGSTPFTMAQSQVNDTPTPAHQVREGLPAWIGPLLDRALAKLPADRFQTADEFRSHLDRAVSGANSRAAQPNDETRLSPASGAASMRAPAAPTPHHATPAGTVAVKKGHLTLVAIAAVVIVGASAGAFFLRGRGQTPPVTTPTAPDTYAPPADGRRGRMGPDGARGAQPIPGRGGAGALFPDVLFLMVTGNESRWEDAILRIGDTQLLIASRRDEAKLRSMPYRLVARAASVFDTAPMFAPNFSAPGPNLVLPASAGGRPEHWLTLQTASEYLVLRLNNMNANRVVQMLQAHVSVPIIRTPR
jgi:hypothetical protein